MKNLASEIMTSDGYIEPKALARMFHTTVEEVGHFTGIAVSTLKKSDRVKGVKAQTQLQSVTEIISKIIPWAGNRYLAFAWYRSEPIPAFGGRTAENLVTDGKADIVKDYIEHLALGGYA